ncbi:transporter [Ferrimonas balearica]|uniref:transporter n=1 Tax=Ferrimonas balearica TaxID=44012 RepID=UPI001C993A26|nr:transporter [Ferrimonas balearica]MBY5991867.1 transporter [Ferrimonas balearica]
MSVYIPAILFTVFTNFLSQILLKKGMTVVGPVELSAQGLRTIGGAVMFNGYVMGGLVVMVISMFSHLYVLSKVEISYAYPFLGLSFVLTTAYGYWVLAEGVNLWRVLGVLFICTGVAIVARN